MGPNPARRDFATPVVGLVAWIALVAWVRPDLYVDNPFALPISMIFGSGGSALLGGRRVAVMWFVGLTAIAISYQLAALDLARSLSIGVAELRHAEELDFFHRHLGLKAAFSAVGVLGAWLVLLRRFAFPRATDVPTRAAPAPTA